MIMNTLTNQQTRVMLLEAHMRTSPHIGNSMGVPVEASLAVVGPGLRQLFGESFPYDGIPEHTRSSPTPGSRYVENHREVSSSTQDTSKVAETEDPIEVFRRIVENAEVLSLDSHAGPIGNYYELFGQLKSKLVGTYFLITFRDNPLVLFEMQGLLLKLSKPSVSGLNANIVLDLESLLGQDI